MSTLGNTTKFASGDDFAREYGKTALRFWLMSIARVILPYDHRISICWRFPLPDRKEVEVIYSDETQKARTTTMKCGQGWVCPVCSLWIAERRRQELQLAIQRARRKYAPLMLTYTMQHDRGMRLADTMTALQASYRQLRSGRWWQEVKEEFGIKGSVRATEVTYGINGWHPHYHELMFVDLGKIQTEVAGDIAEYSRDICDVIEDRWIKMLARRGYDAAKGIALTAVATDNAIAEYIAKWGVMPIDLDSSGITHEIASGAQKGGRMQSLSIWDVLFKAQSDIGYRKLFLEFADATKGRSQLQWTRGLKAELEIEEIRDEIAAQGVETDSDRILATVNADMWRWIAETHRLPVVMTIANQGDDQKLGALLAHLREIREGATDASIYWSLGG